jgi:hypothetical protein
MHRVVIGLAALGIRLVCDSRGPDVRAEEPDRLPASDPPAAAELEIIDAGFSATALRETIVSGDLEAAYLEAAFRELALE